jgi:hypothetical protein
MASVPQGLVPAQTAGPPIDEARLAQQAAGGYGDAFAELYGRYEYDLIERRRRAEPSDQIPESSIPVGSGVGFDPGDPEDDPERRLLLAAGQEEIRVAKRRFPGASARCWRCASWRTSRTTRSRRSWT